MPTYTKEELLGEEEEKENIATYTKEDLLAAKETAAASTVTYTKEQLLGEEEEVVIAAKPQPTMQEMDDVAADKDKSSLFDRTPLSMYPAIFASQMMRDKTPAEKADLARVAASIPIGTTKLVYDAIDIVQSQFSEEEWGDVPFNNAVRKVALSAGVDSESVDRVLDSDGKIKKTETNLGTAAEVGSWLMGTAGLKKLAGEGETLFTEGLKLTGAAAVTSQILSDTSYNTGNVVEDFLSDTENFKSGYAMSFAQALSADDDDSVAVKRLKLLGEEPLFIALGFTGSKGVGAMSWAARKSKELFNKPVSELTAKERSRLTGAFLDDAKERVQISSDAPLEVRLDGVQEEFIPIETSALGRMKSFITPTIKKYFTSQGQFTKKAFDAFKGSEIAQRKWLARSEFVGASLQRSLDDIADATSSAEMSGKVMDSLNSDTSFLSKIKTRKAKIKAFTEKFNLDGEVGKHAYAARELIDELSGKLENIKLPEGTREAIGNNIGAYMRRSYRKYEDPDYEPTPEVYDKAFQYFKQLNKGDEGAAKQQIEDIIGKSGWQEANEHFTNVRALNKKIFTQKKDDEDLPKVVRELLGEIEDPTESLVLSVAKASKLYENMKFYSTFEELGTKGNYIFSRNNVPLRGDTDFEKQKDFKNFVKISGTNSNLDGKYTTKPMHDALMKREETIKMLADNPVYKYFLSLKGLSQANKTVFSLYTQVRNVSGGFQFGLANGLNPVGGSADTVRAIWAGVQKQGDQAIVDKYNEYMGLGVISTSVKVNEFRKLLSEGYEGASTGIMNLAEKKLANYGTAATLVGKGLGKTTRAMEHTYLAVDDFYKINAYEQELATLRKARPNAPTEVIQNEAAEIVKNTFPNYDRVPPGIKAIRQLPFGNFISFPAEIVRTSANIVRRAGKEITSGNDTLRKRGLARLAGFTVSTGSWSGISYAGASYMGWTDEQKEGADVLVETPWSKDSNKLYMMVGGKMASADLQFMDTYQVVKEPLMAIARELEEGKLRGESLDERILNASQASINLLLKPYVSESMLTELSSGLLYASKSPRGVTPKGKEYFSDRQDALDSAWAIAVDAGSTLLPGWVDSGMAIKDLVLDKPIGGIDSPAYVNKSALLIKHLTGINFQEFKPEDNLYWAGKSFLGSVRNIPSIKTDWEKPSERILQEHLNTQEARFEAFQELYRKYQAGIKFYGAGNSSIVTDAFERAGVSKSDINHIKEGLFRPTALSSNKGYDLIRKATTFKDGEDVYYKLQNQIYEMSYTRLDQPLKEQLEEQRERKDKGGEVLDVPQVPKEPDQRIDKMTGRPYNEQAGTAFTDVEDREDPLQRMGFGLGSLVKKKANSPKQNFIERLQFDQGGYVIKSGDTLSEIARKKQTTVEELQRLNDIKDVDKIYAGKKLKVPEYLEQEEEEQEVETVDKDVQQFEDDVAVAVVEKVFSAEDIETELLATRDRAAPVVKAKIPSKVSKDFVPAKNANKYDFSGLSRYGNDPKIISGVAIDAEESSKMTFYEKKEALEKTLKAPVDYLDKLAENWWETRKDVNRRYDKGEITDLERGLWNTAGHINTLTTPVVDLLGAVANGTGYGLMKAAEFVGIDDGVREIGKSVEETVIDPITESEAAKELLRLMEENPRAARNIESVAQIVGAVTALKVFERGFNRIAEGVRTKQEGFYDKGRTSLGKMYIVGKDFAKKVPSAALDAAVPWRSRARNRAGASTVKIADELDTAIQSADRFGSMLTARYIRWQSREKNLGILDSADSPLALANEYKFLDSWNEKEVRTQIFEDVANGGNVGLRVPDKIQDLASAHVKKVWGKGSKGIDEANTGVVIKRPDGPQKLGNEALVVGLGKHSSPIMKAIAHKGGDTFKSSKVNMLEFINDRNKKTIEGKAVADYKAISTKGKDGYLPPSERPFKNQTAAKKAALKKAKYKPIKSLNKVSPKDFKDYLTSKDIKFKEVDEDFIVMDGSHVSQAKEIGGVNDFVAVNTKTGDVFSMISDKHDIGKDIDPIKGRSLLTIQPMISTNWKTLKIPEYRKRDFSAEREAGRKLQQETGIDLKTEEQLSTMGYNKVTGAARNVKGKPNAPVHFMEDVLRDVSTSKDFTAKDVADSVRRTSMLASSSGAFRDTAEEEVDVYKNKETLLSLLRNTLDDKERTLASAI